MNTEERGVEKLTCCWSGLPADLRDEFRAVQCCGSIDAGAVLDALWAGAPGVLVVACGRHDCHHKEGSRQARKMAEQVAQLLTSAGFNPYRVRYIAAARDDRAAGKAIRKALAEMEDLERLVKSE